jgi:hypothetical protein
MVEKTQKGQKNAKGAKYKWKKGSILQEEEKYHFEGGGVWFTPNGSDRYIDPCRLIAYPFKLLKQDISKCFYQRKNHY